MDIVEVDTGFKPTPLWVFGALYVFFVMLALAATGITVVLAASRGDEYGWVPMLFLAITVGAWRLVVSSWRDLVKDIGDRTVKEAK